MSPEKDKASLHIPTGEIPGGNVSHSPQAPSAVVAVLPKTKKKCHTAPFSPTVFASMARPCRHSGHTWPGTLAGVRLDLLFPPIAERRRRRDGEADGRPPGGGRRGEITTDSPRPTSRRGGVSHGLCSSEGIGHHRLPLITANTLAFVTKL